MSSQPVWETPQTKPLDEASWRAWVARGREEDRRSKAALWKLAIALSFVCLLVAARVWL
jgi:hypothetical protein